MKNILKYLKSIFKVLIWPIIFIVGQFLLVIIFGIVFNNTKYNEIKLAHENLNESELTIIYNEYLKTEEYQNSLNEFISSNLLVITIITFVIFGFLFYLNYKKYKCSYTGKIDIKTILFLVLFGVSLNLSYNLILGSINHFYHFTDAYDSINIKVWLYIICTGILGPILEELLFRGIVYNRLKGFNKNMRAIVLTSFIFAVFHQSIIQVLYAFCLSFVLLYVYEKYKTIKAPIIVHMASNVMNIFTCMLIINNNLILNIVILFITLVLLLFINFRIIKLDLVEK